MSIVGLDLHQLSRMPQAGLFFENLQKSGFESDIHVIHRCRNAEID